MPVQTDGTGLFTVGNCVYANHRPTVNARFLKTGIIHNDNFSSELTDLAIAAGLNYRDIFTNSIFDSDGLTTTFSKRMISFGVNAEDTIDDRFTIACPWNNGAGSSAISVQMFNDSGDPTTGEDGYTPNTSPLLMKVGVNLASPPIISLISNANIWDYPQENNYNEAIQVVATADSHSLGIFHTQFLYQQQNQSGLVNEAAISYFQYAGVLSEVNPNFNYYDSDVTTKSVVLVGRSVNFFSTGLQEAGGGAHYIDLNDKLLLGSGPASYAINCADGQTPIVPWMTGVYVFDDNATLGNPAIGRVRNMLFVTGSIPIGAIVDIQGLVFPDAGFTTYVAVCRFADKTLLMKCYTPPDT